MMWRFISPIIIISCFLMNCYSNKSVKKTIIYPDRIETENYTIHKDAKKLPNWSNYYESVIRYNESNGSFFGPSLLRYGVGPRSSDEKGFYLDVIPNHEYALVFEKFTRDERIATEWSCILVKKSSFSQTIELLIPYEDIYRVFRNGRYIVYGFTNEELILKGLYWL